MGWLASLLGVHEHFARAFPSICYFVQVTTGVRYEEHL